MRFMRRRKKTKQVTVWKMYKEDFPEQAYNVCREFGATVQQMASLFNVSIKTIEYWMRKYPEFKQAVQRGRDMFDSEKVERSLLKRALGYDYQYQTKEINSKQHIDKNGKIQTLHNQRIINSNTHTPPDVKACIYWLANRHPDRWNRHILGAINKHAHAHLHAHRLDLSELSDDELFILRGLSERVINKMKDKTNANIS